MGITAPGARLWLQSRSSCQILRFVSSDAEKVFQMFSGMLFQCFFEKVFLLFQRCLELAGQSGSLRREGRQSLKTQTIQS